MLFVLFRETRTCSHLFSLFVSGTCKETAPTPATSLVREPQSPAGVSTVIETCRQAASFQSAEDVVPCASQGDCVNYDTEFGEPCCLVRYVADITIMLPFCHVMCMWISLIFYFDCSLQATRCICGSTADANPCANFGSGSGFSFSSSVTVPTVPTILPTVTVSTPPSAPADPEPTQELGSTTLAPTSAPKPATTPSPPTPDVTAPPPPPPAAVVVALAVPKVVFETCSQAASYQNAEKVVPCASQADCAGYATDFGEPCCLVRDAAVAAVIMSSHCIGCVSHSFLLTLIDWFLSFFDSCSFLLLQAVRCICGSTADANRCANFGPSKGFSSSVTVPTVPTILP
jgi:hypothetical protein